ncbi:EFR1 family ferrodoxin [uncultured Methanoregula sp.]|uniref:EFR1 family ferrodoxin n=1 Tax=uncultured Methanoregula sp. TaxID=1005933 RepID=UPI002AAC4477|nr:EFR1 family ferrodoxin [uncultured Methanoregula sp.]
MKTVIYYFTGTGNTLAVARDIAAELGDTKLVPLRQAMQDGGIVVDADAVGIAFPVYFLNMPAIVRQFVEKLRFSGSPYIFGIATCGERPGGALFRLRELLEANGTTMSAGFVFVMPENYIGPVDLMGDVKRREEKYTKAGTRVPEVAAAIRDRRISRPEGSDSGLLKFGGRITSTLMTSVYNTPRRLHATAACNRCGTCGRICPTRNITVTPGGISWGSTCIQCYACIHWCPGEAIEIGGRTFGKPRYHHPNVTLRDMLDQRGE